MNFNTIEELIKSDASAQGEGEFWHAGPYAYVEDRTNSDLETAGGVRLRYVYGAQYYLNALGLGTGATLHHAIQRTTASGTPIFHTGPFSESLNKNQSLAFLLNWDRVNFLTPGARIVLERGTYDMGKTCIDLTNPYHRNLEVSGKQYSKREIISSKVLSQAPFDHHVQYRLEKAPAALRIGDHITVERTQGPEGCSAYQGVCEVLDIDDNDSNSVTVRVGFPLAKLPTTRQITGRYRPFTSCLKWTAGRGLSVTTVGGIIRCLIIKGYYNPVTDKPSDGPNDGVLIGEQANSYISGITQAEQVNFGWAQLVSVGVTNWPNNGFQNKGGKMRGVDIFVSLCGHRGFQIGNGGAGTVKGIVSSWNANGLEAESGAVITATEAAFVGNLKQGVYALNAKLNISDSITRYNGTHGMDARYLGGIQALRVKAQDNGRNGILCDDLGRVVCQGGQISGNNTLGKPNSNDVIAREGGSIVLRGSKMNPNGITVKSGGRVIDPTGRVVFDRASGDLV